MHCRRDFLCSLTAACLLAGVPVHALAQDAETSEAVALVDRHAWAQFGIGSWKLVRVYTETLAAGGEVESVSITDTRTTLHQADEKEYTLKLEVTVEVAGKRIHAEPKFVTYGYHGELQGQQVEVKQLGASQTEICGQKYATNARSIVINSDTAKSVSTVEYSDTVAPYFLKRSTESIDSETKMPNYHSLVEVIAVEMPEKVLTEVKSAAHVRTIETFSNGGSKVTLEVHCESVPGGVVRHSSKHTGGDKPTTRSTLELVDYEVKPKPIVSKEPTASNTFRRRFSGRRRN